VLKGLRNFPLKLYWRIGALHWWVVELNTLNDVWRMSWTISSELTLETKMRRNRSDFKAIVENGIVDFERELGNQILNTDWDIKAW